MNSRERREKLGDCIFTVYPPPSSFLQQYVSALSRHFLEVKAI